MGALHCTILNVRRPKIGNGLVRYGRNAVYLPWAAKDIRGERYCFRVAMSLRVH